MVGAGVCRGVRKRTSLNGWLTSISANEVRFRRRRRRKRIGTSAVCPCRLGSLPGVAVNGYFLLPTHHIRDADLRNSRPPQTAGDGPSSPPSWTLLSPRISSFGTPVLIT